MWLGLSWNSIGGGVAQLGWALARLGSRHCGLRELELQGADLVAEVGGGGGPSVASRWCCGLILHVCNDGQLVLRAVGA